MPHPYSTQHSAYILNYIKSGKAKVCAMMMLCVCISFKITIVIVLSLFFLFCFVFLSRMID